MTAEFYVTLLLSLTAGLILFLHGVDVLSDALKEAAGKKMKLFLERFTKNSITGVATGTVTTAILDSSSAVIIMVISMVNSGLLSSAASYGVILGANIGTTISSQIIAMKISHYAPLLMLIGFVLKLTAKSINYQHLGNILLAIGLIFFGLFLMDESAKPLHGHKAILEFLKTLEHPLKGAIAGALVTVIIQSSSATVGIVIILAGDGLISFPAAVAIMLGAEIGTCADTLLAVIGRSKEAIRAGVFHLLFNIVSVMIGLVLIQPLISLTYFISDGASIERTIANAHMIFNISGVLLMMWFIPWVSKKMKQLIPD